MVDLIMITAPHDQTQSTPTTPPTLQTRLRPLGAAARVPSECALCGAVGWARVLYISSVPDDGYLLKIGSPDLYSLFRRLYIRS